MALNKAQLEAVVHYCGPCLVLAGPGSGKTFTIVKRIEYLIDKQNVKPEEILVITFTKYAANEMKERFIRQMDGRSLPVTFGTFHGIYYGILKWAYGLGNENIMSEEEKRYLLQEVLEQNKIDINQTEDEKTYIQELIREIGIVKNNRININQYHSKCCQENEFQKIFQQYEEKRKRNNKIDFDDMLSQCYDLFATRPDILEKWQNRFRFILVDEFQDINQIQYDVLKLLAEPKNNLFVVGDDDQSIYAFRGSKPEIMFGFHKDYPNAKELLLNVNYRSTNNITKNALRVIKNNQKRFAKEILAQNNDGKCIHVQEVYDMNEESNYVEKEIQKAISEGVKEEDIAILFRTSNYAGNMVDNLIEHQIRFQMREHIYNIYEHFIAENIASYFRLALGKNSRRDYLAIMNRPNRYLSRESAQNSEIVFSEIMSFYCDKKWMLERVEQLQYDLKMICDMAPYAAIRYIRKKIGYDTFIEEYAWSKGLSKETLEDVINEIEERSKNYTSLQAWLEHICMYTKKIKIQKNNKSHSGIHLLTMHGAKGLEFRKVFIIGANEKIIPHKKVEFSDEIEEERRLFYVAMTRAKEELVISYITSRNGKEEFPSRFVEELLGRSNKSN